MIPERIRWAVSQVELAPAAQVLEIGCGGGHAVALLADRLKRGSIMAIDRSELQVSRARARNAEALAAGRVRIERMTLEQAPERLGEHAFDVAFAINVNAFWTHPEASLACACRLLRKRGQLYLCYEPPSAAQLARLQEGVRAALAARGIPIRAIRTAQFARTRGLCIVSGVG